MCNCGQNNNNTNRADWDANQMQTQTRVRGEQNMRMPMRSMDAPSRLVITQTKSRVGKRKCIHYFCATNDGCDSWNATGKKCAKCGDRSTDRTITDLWCRTQLCFLHILLLDRRHRRLSPNQVNSLGGISEPIVRSQFAEPNNVSSCNVHYCCYTTAILLHIIHAN